MTNAEVSQQGAACSPAWCNYIYNPLSDYRRLVLRWLSAATGDVIDVGCGKSGLYWSLAYAKQCESIHFADLYTDALGEIKSQLQTLTPTWLSGSFGDALEFLDCDSEELASHLDEKASSFYAFDALEDTPRPLVGNFSTVLAVQSIQCVDSIEDLHRFLETTRELLRPGGSLIGAHLVYPVLNERLEALVPTRYEGRLGADEAVLAAALQTTGFTSRRFEVHRECAPKNYHKVILFSAQR